MKCFYCLPLLIVLFAPPAYASCTAPPAEPGVMIFNADHKVMQYCNGDIWVGMGGGGSDLTPAGAIMAFDLTACPSGWSEYILARGRFLRGIDSTGANDTVRVAGNVQADANKSHEHTGTVASAGAHTHSVDPPSTATASAGAHTHGIPRTSIGDAGSKDGTVQYRDRAELNVAVNTNSAGAHTHTLDIPAFNSASAGAHTHSLTIDADGGTEARPKNVAVLYCRKN